MAKRVLTGFTKYITSDELLLLDAWFSMKGDNFKLVYLLMKLCGLRISDAVRVSSSWLQGDYIVFTMQKTKKPHRAYLCESMRRWLHEYYIPKYRKWFQNDFLAFNNNNYSKSLEYHHLQSNTIRTEFHQFRKFYGIKDTYYKDQRGRNLHRISPHTLRHMYAETAYKLSGHNLMLVRDFLGHKDISTTSKYLRGITSKLMSRQVGELLARELSKPAQKPHSFDGECSLVEPLV